MTRGIAKTAWGGHAEGVRRLPGSERGRLERHGVACFENPLLMAYNGHVAGERRLVCPRIGPFCMPSVAIRPLVLRSAMPHVLAMYIPHPERAVRASIHPVDTDCYSSRCFVRLSPPRYGRKATVVALFIGELISFLPPGIAMLVGLGQYGDTCRGFGADHSDSVLILTEHFELYSFAVWSFSSLVLSALILFMVKTKANQGEPDGRAEAPPPSPDSDRLMD